MTDKTHTFEKHDAMRGESSVDRKRQPRSDTAADAPDSAGLQHAAGNLAVQRLLQKAEGLLQKAEDGPQLAVSQPDDFREREADQLAEQVPAVESPQDAADADAQLPAAKRTLPPAPSLVRNVLGSSGLPLDAATRAPMEEFFGSDLSSVRIHTGERADASARALNALAYTVGNEIVFREGQHSPGTSAGERLLAHELAHVARDSGRHMVHRDKDPATEDPAMLRPGAVEVPEASEVGAVNYQYPWQYPDVRKAIYQHREESLTEFLRIYAEIEIDKGLIPVKDVTAPEIQAERERVEKEKTETNDAIKGDPKNETLQMKWVRLKNDLEYLNRLPKGKLPTNPAALERVKKMWTAYLYSKKDDTGKDLEHDELLGRVLDRFDADPTFDRYPKWLRYMVLHFSGLRYEGAHGSYAPVTDLVKRLKTEEVKQRMAGASEKEVDRLAVTAETELEAESKQAPRRARAGVVKSRLADLGAVETTIQKAFANKGDESKLKAFEELMDVEAMREKARDMGDAELEEELDQRAAELAKLIGGARLAGVKRQVAEAKKRRQQALLVHEIERAQKEIATLDDAQALAMLKRMHTEGAFPDWFWLEVVRATALRLEAEGTEWTKKMSYAEMAALKKAGPVTRQWLGILGEWKKEATAWRAKHEKDLALVVSRSVCNEVAEQAQHARGVTPAGGIGQKATWYKRGTKEGRSFARPTQATVVRGASLFWAKWADAAPTDNVHKVRSDLFPILRNEEGETISDGMTDSQDRTYHVVADNLVTRTVPISTSIDPSIPPYTKTQWLVWFHEATVADVIGDRVLTFETGPIGLHDRWRLKGIVDNTNIYVGFAPEGPEPKDVDKYLKDILPGR